MIEVVLRLLDILLYLLNLVICLLRIVARDTNELQLRKALNILQGNLSLKLRLKWLKSLIHSLVGSLTGTAALNQLIELILDKDTLQRCRVPSLVKLVELDLQLLAE